MKKRFQVKDYLWQIGTLALVVVVLFFFAGQKEGYHMDEVLSYQLANSEYNPFIITDKPTSRLAKFMAEEVQGESLWETAANMWSVAVDVVKNGNSSKLMQSKADTYPEAVWFSGEQFVDYMTVNEKDGFNPLSAYLGAQADTHPPLYYMALHTACSLVPGSASPMIACTLNILMIVGIGILLMKLTGLLEQYGVISQDWGKPLGIAVVLLYGLSAGGISTMLLARMYGLTTLFAVWSFYLHLKKYYGEGFTCKRFGLALVTAAGFLSQYFFVFYCIPLALVTGCILALKKRYRELWNYIATMVGAGVLGVGVFPFCISDLFSSTMGNSVTGGFALNWERFSGAVSAMGNIGLDAYFGNRILGVVVILVLLVLAVLAGRMKKDAVTTEKLSGSSVFYWLLFAPVVLGFLLISNMTIYWMPRYLMPLFPFVALGIGVGLQKVFALLNGKARYLVFLPVLALSLFSTLTYKDLNLYRGYDKQIELAEEYGDYSCICFNSFVRYYENVPEFMEYDRTLITYLYDFEIRQDKEQLQALDEVIVLRKSEVEEERMFQALKDNGFEMEEKLLDASESPWGDTIYLWKKIK